MERKAELDAVLESLRTPPGVERAALLLRTLEDRSYEEIADVLKITVVAALVKCIGRARQLTSLRRTRTLLRWQRRLLAWAIAAAMTCLSSVFYTENGHFRDQFLLGQYPWAMAVASAIAVSCWVNYFLFARRLRVTQL